MNLLEAVPREPSRCFFRAPLGASFRALKGPLLFLLLLLLLLLSFISFLSLHRPRPAPTGMMAQSKANGSHYALTAIGLGMLVLGVIMAMWNLVPGFSAHEKPTAQGNNKTEIGSGILKSKTFSVAYVLVGAGVMLLLLSICLSIRDKRKQRQGEEMAHIQHQPGVEPHAPEEDR